MKRILCAVSGLALLLGACAAPTPSSRSDSASSAANSTPGPGEAEAFPLTLEQEGGPITLDRQPERIYVVDNWGLDLVADLGVTPVGVATYFPPSAWLASAPALKGVEMTTITDALPIEKVAAARPDLIVDLTGNFGSDPAVSAQLDKLAPVLNSPKDTNTDGWRERVRHLGKALGRSAAAEDSISEAERSLDAINRQFPALQGASVTFARFDPPGSFAIVADDADFTRRFLDEELGFTTPVAQRRAYDSGRFQNAGGVIEGVSLERLDLLDADADAALIWFQDDKNLQDLERQSVWAKVPFVTEKRLVPMNIDAAIALRTPTPASIAWTTETLLPDVAAAIARRNAS